MFYNSNNFKILEAGLRLNKLQQDLHLQNIANIETPGYKAKSLVFKELLKEASNPKKIKAIRAAVVENEDSSTQPDGNNVDYEAESIGLYKTYVQHSMLLDKISGEFDKYSYVLNSNIK
ncbi:MAG TPA: flagellar biosynthesis protein FlgB [Clostridiales bacterium]|jgi:flagellar basal-body rod protein FlgB|nr:flagellar biosynthesis protein FlgB [Clostridiales bacterium]